MLKKTSCLLLLCIFLLASGITTVMAEEEKPADDTIVIVNGEPLSRQAFQAFINFRMGNNPRKNITRDQLQMLMVEYINRELMYQEAIEKGYDKKPEVEVAIDNTQRNIIASYRAREIINQPISEEALRELYKERISKPEQEYKVRHILVKTEEEARDIIKALQNGASFDKLAREKSIDVSAKNGGALEWVSEEQMIVPFRKIVPGLKPGEFSTTAVRTRFGWHVIGLDAKRDIDPPSFDSIKDKLRAQLQNDMLMKHIEALRKNSEIVVK